MSATISRSISIALAAAATVAIPAIASAKKPTVVIVPASAIADPAAKICMPRMTSPQAVKDKTLPETLCDTVEAWGERGVTIRAK